MLICRKMVGIESPPADKHHKLYNIKGIGTADDYCKEDETLVPRNA